MSCGKTTTAKKFAKNYNFNYLDTDNTIIKKTGLSIIEYFKIFNEKKFRYEEKKIIEELELKNNIIISTGGGLACDFSVLEKLNSIGETIYLKVKPKTLYKRLITNKKNRPLIKDKNKSQLIKYIFSELSKREIFYNKAKYILDVENYSESELLRKIHTLVFSN